MINKSDTTRILLRFFTDCFRFWLNEGKDIMQSLTLALRDISEINCNPFEPAGELLDVEAKQEFINRIQKDLLELCCLSSDKKI